MSDDNQHSRDLSEHQNTVGETKQGCADLSRRKFAKAGLIAAPVVMSLTSRPVLGNQCSLSGMLSTTYSGPESALTCAGRTPGFWKTHPDYWPQASVYPGKIVCGSAPSAPGNIKVGWNRNAATTMFSDVFGLSYPHYDDQTMMNLIWLGGDDDRFQLGAHTIAAWFNSQRTEFEYGLTPEEVIARFQSVVAGTYPGNNLPAAQGVSPEEALKLEFQYLNERGSIDLGGDYEFRFNPDYWIDLDTYDRWLAGEDVSCATGGSFFDS